MTIGTRSRVASHANAGEGDPIRVMVVDDSAVVRGLITRIVDAEPDLKVVASVGNGERAVNHVVRERDVDVVILDVEMPVMDGLTALPKLMQADPGLKVIMASTLTVKNAEISIRALQAGAADYVPKPSASQEIAGGSGEFKRDLVAKTRTLGATRRPRPGRSETTAKGATATFSAQRAASPPASTEFRGSVAASGLRSPSKTRPDVIAIGSSTGGPQALFELFRGLPPKSIEQPILITQHMPATFTAILAEHLSRQTGWRCTEGKPGEPISPGCVYLAPGDWHMTVRAEGTQRVIQLDQGPQENFCRPAVDPMLRSIARVYGGRALVVMLTGMGADGQKGSEAIVAAGGTVVAQDEASSVVWGMPGAVATAGLCAAVLPLPDLAPYVEKMARRPGS